MACGMLHVACCMLPCSLDMASLGLDTSCLHRTANNGTSSYARLTASPSYRICITPKWGQDWGKTATSAGCIVILVPTEILPSFYCGAGQSHGVLLAGCFMEIEHLSCLLLLRALVYPTRRRIIPSQIEQTNK
jgi:hypothetical protein